MKSTEDYLKKQVSNFKSNAKEFTKTILEVSNEINMDYSFNNNKRKYNIYS